MNQLAHRHSLWSVFSDFVEMAAISMANAVDHGPQHAEREARYMAVIKGYSKDELDGFCRMLAHLTMAMEQEPGDVLGSVFMQLELGSKWHGQFFTPYEVCRLMAGMQLGDGFKQEIERKGYITAMEPACGGGAMILALAEEMQAAGVNYQRHLHVTAIDIDIKAVHMAYLQFSLMHIPAIIVHGNALAVEERSRWYTPAHILGGWTYRLQRSVPGNAMLVRDPKPAAPAPAPAPTEEAPAPAAARRRQAPPASGWEQGALF